MRILRVFWEFQELHGSAIGQPKLSKIGFYSSNSLSNAPISAWACLKISKAGSSFW